MRVQTAEINEPSHTRSFRSFRERTRSLRLGVLEVAPRTHRVHEVESHVDTGHRATRRDGVRQVCLEHSHATPPRDIAQLPWRTNAHAHVVPRIEQLRNEPPADVARRTRDEYTRHTNIPSLAQRISSNVITKPTA